jgi:hypothetical protein
MALRLASMISSMRYSTTWGFLLSQASCKMLQWHWLADELITLKWNQELWNQLILVAIHKTP